MALTQELFDFILRGSADEFLDAVELSCRVIESRFMANLDHSAQRQTKDAVSEINYRFRKAGIGYEFSDGEMIKVDSRLLHKEAVVAALEVLRLPGYKGAQSEFLKAHEHYRHSRNSEAIMECHKAFESMMKSICDKRRWRYDASKPAGHLIEVCLKNGLLERYNENYLTGLKMVHDSAVPTPRNKDAAHGAGSVPKDIPNDLAAYVIHLTAATLLFLAKSEQAL